MRLCTLILFVLIYSVLFDRVGGGRVYAQQLSFSSQYYSNPFVLNPALTGNTTTINAFITHRSQWVSVPGSPQTSYITADGPLDQKNLGLGIKIYTFTTDILSRLGAFATYSYKIKLNETSNLNLGLGMGMLDNKIDYAKALVNDVNDPFLLQQQQSKAVFSADFGVLYTMKGIELGFAVPQVLANKIKYGNLTGADSYYNLSRHYQGTIKYKVDLVKAKGITAYPLIMFRSVGGAPLQFDVNAVVDWKKTGWFGITYHSSYALAVSAGLRYKNLSIGYAYDIGMSKIKTYTGGSTEFLLGYTFNKKDPYVIDTTRGDIWAEQIQSSAALVKPEDYDDAYWKAMNKNVDQQKIFNTIVEGVLSGKVQAYDLVTDSPLTVTQVEAFLSKAKGPKAKGGKKVTEKDLSKIRMSEKWVFDKGRFTLVKQVYRIDLLIKRLDEAGQYTGDDRPLFYVKLKR
ncbi:MAG: PorP/SprF family type IX secretion system membrane protein [Bacteroidia bacterium]